MINIMVNIMTRPASEQRLRFEKLHPQAVTKSVLSIISGNLGELFGFLPVQDRIFKDPALPVLRLRQKEEFG